MEIYRDYSPSLHESLTSAGVYVIPRNSKYVQTCIDSAVINHDILYFIQEVPKKGQYLSVVCGSCPVERCISFGSYLAGS
ncbi:hypothetical protein M405DRAFT_817075 [Rhizopogon salebrosus TDB-379]|nr:hypothetical protein M405DRAFT_817075 [Rhizopogon salebrosus TDB-379]